MLNLGNTKLLLLTLNFKINAYCVARSCYIVEMTFKLKNLNLFTFIRNNEVRITNMKDMIASKFGCRDTSDDVKKLLKFKIAIYMDQFIKTMALASRTKSDFWEMTC